MIDLCSARFRTVNGAQMTQIEALSASAAGRSAGCPCGVVWNRMDGQGRVLGTAPRPSRLDLGVDA
jgi:hypothetical protein